MQNKKSILIEKLVELKHKKWLNWAKNILENENLSKTTVKRWKDYFVPYNELSESAKELDRNYARKVLDIINLEK